MPTTRGILGAVTLGVAISLATLTPAHAAQQAVTTIAPADGSSHVTGEPWSAPAYPVICRAAANQVNCAPDNPADVKPEACYLGVLLAGSKATVCTTYEAHATALQAAGGKPAIVQYGCTIGDLICGTFETAGRGMAYGATGMMFAVVANMRFDTGALLWTAAVDEWSFWQWAILGILLGSMIWAITAAIVSGDRAQVIGAILRTFIAIPAVPITLWLTGHLLNAVDDMTWYIMNRDGPNALFATLQGVMWAGGQANYWFAFLIHGLLALGMLLMMLVFAFRNIVLAALIAVGPIAWMMFPVRSVGPQWVVRYVSAVAVLLLTGPLTIGFITLIINGLSTVSTIWDPQSWPLLAGLVLVAFAPFAVFGLFSFVGAVASDGLSSAVSGRAGALGARAARTALTLPTRLGGSPAGNRPPGGRPSPTDDAGTAAGSVTGVRGPSAPAFNASTTTPTGTGPTGAAKPTKRGSSSTPPSPPTPAPTPTANTASRSRTSERSAS